MSRGILIVNLGTPDSPSPCDVKRYLKQFLMDPYVIDKPFWFRYILVHWIIAPFRSKKSAKLYEKVWTADGSPLLVYSEKFCRLLAKTVSPNVHVALGMRYGNPDIASALQALYQKAVDEILVFPMYPQYAESSTQTALDEVLLHHTKKSIPLEFFPSFFKEPLFVDVLSNSIRKQWESQKFDHLLLSYHGLPERHLTKLDHQCIACLKNPVCSQRDKAQCYRSHAYQTSELIQNALGLSSSQITTSFQSRLGKDPWIAPHIDQTVRELAKQGKSRLLVACPSFVTDCLETLEEIGITSKNLFLQSGGQSFELVDCLNDSQAWVEVVATWAQKSFFK